MQFVGDELSKIESIQLNQIWTMINDEQNLSWKHSLKVMLAAIMGFSSNWMFSSHV